MKNKIKSIFKILTIVAGCLIFASFSPSLDGRAVVVDNGVFPQGLFAKTVGYLPGDIISVTNIAGDKTIDLLVIGALDPSEGVAIMLSPEAADAMGIDRGANNIVKITKRSGQEERVYGNAIISKSAADIEDWDDGSFENISAEENTEAFDDTAEAAPEAAVEAEAEDTAEEFAEPEDFEETEEESFDEEAEETEDFAEEEAFEESEDEAISEEEEAFAEETEETEETEEPEAEEALEEEAFADEAEEYTEEAPEELEETAEAEAFDAEELDELQAEEESFDEEAEEADLPGEEEFDSEPSEEEFNAEDPEELTEEEEAPAAEAFEADDLEDLPAEELTEEEPEELTERTPSEDFESEEYEAIVLVPAESNPPESDSDEVEDVISDEQLDEIDEEISLKPFTEEITESVSSVPVETKTSTGSATSYDKYIVPSLNQLESGKYYIQIAAYSSDENILDVINKYGSNYPITIVPMAGGKTKQVLIGPVTMDEYKVVLERFKSYGFKDAFLRKVK